MTGLADWAGVPRPERKVLEGQYVWLEPFDADKHTAELFAASSGAGTEDRFRYLFEEAPADLAEMAAWGAKAAQSTDPLFFAVIDKKTGRVAGRQTLMRIDTTHGVIEIGHIYWGPAIARTQAATEALFLFADYCFGLGYRRFEWKCNDQNEPSKRAAARFGFTYEGRFRQHMVTKGANRDTAWFAIIDQDWPRLRAAYQHWLEPANFDETGQQRSRLATGA
ncbi:GNAT family N-acetyltransferase [Paracoccus aminophilus]|uniref:GCN5-related N-acetyltransferase n=1 Tax=Paracoccus aminophilus JCM 7686 TaxID=1367847 RepID=S5YTF9_PARAH|nr:GNAT family protein [Paracoccus aminophilus]AGT08511.1 GCN5-related N-acetyltransferase [Paracoccus aminophilus JCM 7686]